MSDILQVMLGEAASYPLLVGSFFGFLGLIVGSFLNVLVIRTEKEQPITGRSHCPHCGYTLTPYDLVPLLSYLWLKGRCRKCNASLSMQYPLVEAGTGILFALTYFFTSDIANALKFLPIAALSLAIVTADIRTTYIPNSFLFAFLAYSAIAYVLLSIATHSPGDALVRGGEGILLAAPLFALVILSRGRAMGMADAWILLGIGWTLGWSAGIAALLIAFWAGALVSVLFLLVQKLRLGGGSFLTYWRRTSLRSEDATLTMKSEIPFGPFLIGGMLLVFYSGITFDTLLYAIEFLFF